MTHLEAAALRLAVARRQANDANDKFRACLRNHREFLPGAIEAKTQADIELGLAVDGVVSALSEQLESRPAPATLAAVTP